MHTMFWFGLMLAVVTLVVLLFKGGLRGSGGGEGGFLDSDGSAGHGDSDGGGDGGGD